MTEQRKEDRRPRTPNCARLLGENGMTHAGKAKAEREGDERTAVARRKLLGRRGRSGNFWSAREAAR